MNEYTMTGWMTAQAELLERTQGWPVRPLIEVLQTFIRPVAAQHECPELAGSRSWEGLPKSRHWGKF